MIIRPLQNTNGINFTSGKSTLFADFDGTFLPQPMTDVYSGDIVRKNNAVSDINKYFSQIQDFVSREKGDFDIVITTGRRLAWNRVKGFVPFLGEMKGFGIVFPKISRLITAEGGDVHDFLPDGSVNAVPNQDKKEMITRLSGWDNEKIKHTLDSIAKETDTTYSFVNPKGSYKLSIKLGDEKKLELFHQKLLEMLGKDMKFKSKITEVKEYSGENSATKSRGIKMEPLVEGSKLHKDFDVKIAIKKAIQNNDFVLAAGDASNDKEMLNIFRYINYEGKIPEIASDITPELVAKLKPEIDKLPLKILFVRPNPDEVKKLPLLDFMKTLEHYFPEKVQIIEQTFPGKRNFFLEAVENAVNTFKNKGKGFSSPQGQPPKNKILKYILLGAAIASAGAFALKKIFLDAKEENIVQTSEQKTYQFFA